MFFPDLNNGNSENNKTFIESLIHQGKDTKNRINCILLWINSQSPKFTKGIREVNIEIMNCYPLKKFLSMLLLLENTCL